MSRCAPPSPSPRRTLRSLSSSAIRSARVFHDCTVNSFSRSSSSVKSSSASTPSTPRSAAISATVLPSYLFSPADLTSCTVIRAQSAKEAGRFRSCLNWFLKFTSLYTADCAALDVSSNSRFHDGNAPNANGLRMVSSRVSGSGEVCGRAPRDHRPHLRHRLAQRVRQVVAVEHRDERDRPPALLQHEVEQLELRLLKHCDLPRHRELDRTLA